MKKSILFVFFLSIISISVYSQWYFQNPKPTGIDLNTGYFIDSLTGWAAGSYSLLHTTDGGITWDFQDPDQYLVNPSLCFTDADHGWLTGGDRTIFHTSDGGLTWESQSWTTGSTLESLSEIFFVDNMHGWAVGGAHTNGVPPSNFIIHTTNGGDTWNVQYMEDGIRLNGVYFTDLQHGWAVGFQRIILHTSNGGQTWSVQPSGGNNVTFSDVYFTDQLNGWAVGYHYDGGVHHGYIFHTSDGGNSWQLQLDELDVHFLSVCFTSQNTGWVSGGSNTAANGIVYMTTDGGNSWELKANDSVNSLRWICSSDSSHIWSVGDIGSIMSSSDGGYTWTHLDQRACFAFTEYDEASISFPDSLHGWIAGGDSVLLHTDNGGQLWVRQPTQFGKKIRSVSFPDAQYGWAIMDSTGGRCIIRTENGGETWQLVYTGLNESYFDIFFISPFSGWLAGYEGIIKHTSDGGYTWTTQHADPHEKYLDLFFLDSLNGWAAGGSIYWDPGIILHTNDGGTTWEQQYEGSECFSSICFADLSYGWAVNYHECFKTENGGLTWEMFSDTSLHMKSVTCSDPMHVYMAGTTGAIYYSSDGGTTWCLQDSHGTPLYAIQAIDSLSVYAFGLNGIVLHTSNGGVIPVGFTEMHPGNEVDWQQCLAFPNPTSEYTSISLNLKSPTKVEINLYDPSGRLVSQKPFGILPRGRNTVNIDVSNYPPGLYTCCLIIKDKVQIVKIIVK